MHPQNQPGNKYASHESETITTTNKLGADGKLFKDSTFTVIVIAVVLLIILISGSVSVYVLAFRNDNNEPTPHNEFNLEDIQESKQVLASPNAIKPVGTNQPVIQEKEEFTAVKNNIKPEESKFKKKKREEFVPRIGDPDECRYYASTECIDSTCSGAKMQQSCKESCEQKETNGRYVGSYAHDKEIANCTCSRCE